MSLTNLLFQIVGGALGGTLAGEAFTFLSFGHFLDSFAGIIGGVLGVRLLQYVLATSGGPVSEDLGSIVINLAAGCLGGALFTTILGQVAIRKG